MSESDSFSDEHDDDDDEEDQISTCASCLFCNLEFPSIELALEHCSSTHNFNFQQFSSELCMDCYSFIKFINYIRLSKASPEEIIKLEAPLWNDDKFLKPVCEDDPWLMFDFEEYFTSTLLASSDNSLTNKTTTDSFHSLLNEKEEIISCLHDRLTKLNDFVHRIVDDHDGISIAQKPRHNSIGYFESYENPGIHYDMLSDQVRTESYKNAILSNIYAFKDKYVMDLGCGTGILSMFAVSAGAEHVLAIDNSDIAYSAIEIIRENELESKIRIVKSRIEDLSEDIEKVDVIISEWMGYFLLYEGMLDSLIYSRDKYLKSDGVLIPDKCELLICGASDPDGHNKNIGFWSNVYGFRMSCIMKETRKQAVVDTVPPSKIVTDFMPLTTFNLYTCTIEDTEFSSPFTLTALQDTIVTTLVGYFDTVFNLNTCVKFSTSPYSPTTHWQQTLFHLYEPVSLMKDQQLSGTLICKRRGSNNRALTVTILIKEKSYIYHLD